MAIINADDFTAAVAGFWTNTDTESKDSIVANRLYVDSGKASPAWGDPGLRTTATLTRGTLGGFSAIVRLTNLGGDGPGIGLQPVTNPVDPSAGGSGLVFDYPDLKVFKDASFPTTLNPDGRRLRSIDYVFTVLVRATSGYLVAVSVPVGSSGGPYPVFPLAKLLWVEDTGSDASLYAHLSNHSGRYHVDRAVIYDSAELPTALSTRYGAAAGADDFTAANGTNISGRVTPQGAKTWTLTGTATVQSNQAQLSAGATARFNAGVVPRTIQGFLTRGAGATASIRFRGDGTVSGTWRVKAEFDRIRLENPSGGTEDQTGAISFTQDVEYHVRVIDTGTWIHCLVNGRVYISWQSTLQNTNTNVGIGAESGQCLFNDFAAYPDTITLPTSIGPVLAVPSPTGSTLLSFSFTAADGTSLPTYNANWTIRAGSWDINGNRARISAAGVAIATVPTGAAGVNHTISADITMPSATVTYPIDWFPGVFCRYTDPNNFIYARLLYQQITPGDGGSPEVELWQRLAGTGTLIGYVNLGNSFLLPNSIHNLRLAVDGAEAVAWLNGEPVVQATTGVLTGSNAGIGRHEDNPANLSGTPYFDNVTLHATSTADTTPPVVSGVSSGTPGPTTTTISWTTNELADSQIEYGLTTGYGSFTLLQDTSPRVTSHSVFMSGLTPSTTYNYRILTRDASGNLTTDINRTFTTAPPGAVVSNIQIPSVTQTTATVTCDTDVAATVRLEYGTTPAYGTNTADTSSGTSHSRSISGLTAGTTYYARFRAIAGAITSYSAQFTISTPAVGASTVYPDYRGHLLLNLSASGNNYFTLGHATAGRLGTGKLLDEYPDASWTNLASRLLAADTRHGRENDLAGTTAGQMAVVVDNDDGALDPDNPSAPAPFLGNLRSNRRLRLQAVWNGTTYTLGYMLVDSYDPEPVGATGSNTTITATDLFKRLEREPLRFKLPRQKVGERIGTLLDMISWPLTKRNLGNSHILLPEYQPESFPDSMLQHLHRAVSAERGLFFVAGNGNATFQGRYYRQTAASRGTFGAGTSMPLKLVRARYSEDGLVNQVSIQLEGQNEGQPPYTIGDAISQRDNGTVSYTVPQDIADILGDDLARKSYAQGLLNLLKNPPSRIQAVELNAHANRTALWPHMLAAEVGDKITVTHNVTGTKGIASTDFFIESVSHIINVEQRLHRTVWAVSKAYPMSYLRLGHATYGKLGTGRLGF
jgi:hypothetical protein